ncbi:MAG: DUF4262 domain-containing protein [Acidimicrobiales bacterium]|nr:DUF4262 domain-containing protein [Acidimicrobiales bacterium]
MTEEEVARRAELIFRVYGWMLESVEEGPDGAGWSYTVGLSENFDHPDLIILDGNLGLQIELVRAIADMVVDEGGVNDEALAELDIELVPVDPNELEQELITCWLERYERWPSEGEFLQVIPPAYLFCDCHAHERRRLG